MAVRISTAARNALANAITTLVDGGSSAAKLRVYTGSQPAGPGTAASGTLLLEVTLNDPSFGSAPNGTITAAQSPALSGTAVANGTAGWFRILDSTEAGSTGLGVLDGSVTATGGGGDCQLSTTSLSTGLSVSITSITVTMPSG